MLRYKMIYARLRWYGEGNDCNQVERYRATYGNFYIAKLLIRGFFSMTKATDLWRTPPVIVDICERVFELGKIDLDPTADEGRTLPAEQYITESQNCLGPKVWIATNAYMNPPFSNPLPFVKRLSHECVNGTVDETIALLKSGCIHNKGTGKIIAETAKTVCFWGAGKQPRLGFLDSEGHQSKNADFDCILVYWGPNWYQFVKTLKDYGTVVIL